MSDAHVQLLLEVVARAYDRRSWHGTNLRGSIRGIGAAMAAKRPRADRHNIWELVVHAAYWKYAVRRRLTGEMRGSFDLQGSNWFERPADGAATEAAWRNDVALLDRTHAQLRAAIAALRDADLRRRVSGSSVTGLELVAGIAAHDLYHAGQIQLLKRLVRRGA